MAEHCGASRGQDSMSRPCRVPQMPSTEPSIAEYSPKTKTKVAPEHWAQAEKCSSPPNSPPHSWAKGNLLPPRRQVGKLSPVSRADKEV